MSYQRELSSGYLGDVSDKITTEIWQFGKGAREVSTNLSIYVSRHADRGRGRRKEAPGRDTTLETTVPVLELLLVLVLLALA